MRLQELSSPRIAPKAEDLIPDLPAQEYGMAWSSTIQCPNHRPLPSLKSLDDHPYRLGMDVRLVRQKDEAPLDAGPQSLDTGAERRGLPQGMVPVHNQPNPLVRLHCLSHSFCLVAQHHHHL